VARPAEHNLIPFGDHVLDGETQVGQGREVHGHELFLGLNAAYFWSVGVVADVSVSDELVHCIDVSLVPYFDPTPQNGLVIFRHTSSLLLFPLSLAGDPFPPQP